MVSAGAGNDTVYVNARDVALDGGAGDDLLSLQFRDTAGPQVVFDASGSVAMLALGAGPQMSILGFERFEILGEGQNDRLQMGAGDDWAGGGSGDDLIRGGAGNDMALGGDGNDLVQGDDGDDVVAGSSGNDVLLGGAGNDYLSADGGWDQADPNDDSVDGGSGNDQLFSTEGSDTLLGGTGDDTVTIFARDLVGSTAQAFGGDGRDLLQIDLSYPADAAQPVELRLTGGVYDLRLGQALLAQATGFEAVDLTLRVTGAIHVTTGAGADLINVAGSAVTLVAGAGNDTVTAQGDSVTVAAGLGNDQVTGGTGGDLVNGEEGNDILLGYGGQDNLYGGTGNDIILGGEGNDALFGGDGVDRIVGGMGRDYMAGATGADLFVFKTLADSGTGTSSTVVDKIGFFETLALGGGYIDRVDLSALDADALVTGNQAFAFIGTATFTAAGQVRVQQIGNATYVQVNSIGSSGADLAICLPGVIAASMEAVDFIL